MSTEISTTTDNTTMSRPRAIGLGLSGLAIGAFIATHQMPTLNLQALQLSALITAVALSVFTALPELYEGIKQSLQNHFNIAFPITLGATIYGALTIAPIALRLTQVAANILTKG